MSGDRPQSQNSKATNMPDEKKTPSGMVWSEQRNTFVFAAGNDLWKRRLRHGIQERKFETAQDLLEEVVGYFNWVIKNPLQEAKLVAYEGDASIHRVPKMRAMTLAGLCLYCGISRDTWGGWRRHGDKHRADLADVIRFAEEQMYSYKFDGAAAGLLNTNIIARDLGLAERTEISGPGGSAIRTINSEMTPQEAAEAYADMLREEEQSSNDT